MKIEYPAVPYERLKRKQLLTLAYALEDMRDRAIVKADTARQLVAEALHLRANGEHAPGGHETWTDWEQRAETYLRATEDGR